MPKTYKLEIPGRPRPKYRVRVTKKATFTPEVTRKYEQKVLAHWLEKYGNDRLEGDLELRVKFVFPDKKFGDISNVIKSVEDSLAGKQTGLAVFNDKQIKTIHATREVDRDSEGKAIIEIRQL